MRRPRCGGSGFATPGPAQRPSPLPAPTAQPAHVLSGRTNANRRPHRRGYTACHVAAQYAQTSLLYHLALKWGADTDAPDGDGRTPLHWAAYKGASDTARLLLVLGARPGLQDREGCTPLHWAAIRGNSEACTALVQVRQAAAARRHSVPLSGAQPVV